MSVRQITVFSMADNTRKVVNTAATTWGQVLESSKEIDAMVQAGMKIIIKETKGGIESKDTILPAIPLTIYLTPDKVKSGMDARVIVENRFQTLFDQFAQALKKDLEYLADLETKINRPESKKVSGDKVLVEKGPLQPGATLEF